MPEERTDHAHDQDPEHESGEERQGRIQREQHRPEQNDGYDEAVQQPGITPGREVPPDQRPRRGV